MMQCYSNDVEDSICILFLSTYHSQGLITYPVEAFLWNLHAVRITDLWDKNPHFIPIS